MLKVLALSKYDLLAASARQRFGIYQPGLRERGIELGLSPLFDDRYLEDRFATGKQRPIHIARALLRRSKALFELRRWDLAIVHYELVPYLPSILERLALSGIPYVMDFDDAVFHTYDQHHSPWVRRLFGHKIEKVVGGAAGVIAGSRYLADYASRTNSNVHLIPTVIDLDRYRVKATPGSGPFTVGWIGAPSTAVYLDLLKAPLERLGKEGPVKLIAVGATPFTIPGVDVEIRPWADAREVDDLLECDVGVMPMPDSPWSRGKCAFKLIQYMACGLPVIASPVGANHEVVTPEVGMFAADDDAWVAALRRLRDDPSLRSSLGRAGRARVEARFSLQSQLDPMAAMLKGAADGKQRHGAN